MTSSKARSIVEGLGGISNITQIEPCITRLRAEVKDVGVVVEQTLKDAGAFGVVRTGRIIQVIVGPEADELAVEIDALR